MKKLYRLLLGILIAMLLSACGSSTTSSSSRTNNSSGYSSSSGSGNQSSGSSSSSSSGSSQSANSSNAEFSIPYRAENSPNGVLDQLAWFGSGGSDGVDWYDGTSRCQTCDLTIQNNKLSLYGFESNQTLNIPLYEPTGFDSCKRGTAKYITTITVTTNSNGNIDVKLKGNTSANLASGVYDAYTGVLLVKTNLSLDNSSCTTTTSSSSSCPGAPPQKLEVGDKAYVCTRTDSVRLRDGAGKQYNTIKSLVPGADIKIVGGPKCADNWSWWKVETESGYVGWIAEGGDNVDPYFICPK